MNRIPPFLAHTRAIRARRHRRWTVVWGFRSVPA